MRLLIVEGITVHPRSTAEHVGVSACVIKVPAMVLKGQGIAFQREIASSCLHLVLMEEVWRQSLTGQHCPSGLEL